jgi:hypothetical protein
MGGNLEGAEKIKPILKKNGLFCFLGFTTYALRLTVIS